ncbi:DinB family protein [Cryptosporangium sp. NPDC048952]|uniref:DinB family protein n=1 Tax=Cryptosporangium sp. NPDC048952 TaxID=3363961 RepID=UPI00371253B8
MEPPIAGTEAETWLGSLDRQRATLLWKCTGLDAEGLNTTVGASTMTLGGLLKHLALVEDQYFTVRLRGGDYPAVWSSYDGDGWEWRSAADDSPEDLIALWKGAVERSRAAVAAALEEGDLGQLTKWKSDSGHQPSLRRVLADLLEEYARHVGHADLIREAVDGLVGEDPPG